MEGKISRCMEDLREWNRKPFGNVLTKLQKVREELRLMHKRGMSGLMVAQRRQLERKEVELMEQEEKLWFQRARSNEVK